jgi:siroheme synthase (precorrin-2 oxidase/ferrochelatase)
LVLDPHEYAESGGEVRRYRATFERFAVALVEVATGQHDLNDAIEEQALRVLMGRAAADEDHEVNDCIIQVALFGKVVYG